MFLLLLQRFWLHLLIALVFSVAGYKLAPKPNKPVVTTSKEVVTQSKQVSSTKEIVKAQNVIDRVTIKTITKAGKPKTVIKERIVKGPVTALSTTTTTSKSKVDTNTLKETRTVTASQNMARFSLGIAMAPARIMSPRASDVVVDIGVRLGNLPLWLTGSYGLQSKATVGVRFEF